MQRVYEVKKVKRLPMILVSRDRRTASHFRSAWKSAACKLTNVKPVEITRFETSIFSYFTKLIGYKLRNKFILVFGVSEMLLLGWLKPSVGVVTGLGRLLSKGSKQIVFLNNLHKSFAQNPTHAPTSIAVSNLSTNSIDLSLCNF